jgi:hypothetical protein
MKDDLPVEQLLKTHKPEWVQCNDVMCLAVLDKDGKWRSFSNNKELFGIVKVYID